MSFPFGICQVSENCAPLAFRIFVAAAMLICAPGLAGKGFLRLVKLAISVLNKFLLDVRYTLSFEPALETGFPNLSINPIVLPLIEHTQALLTEAGLFNPTSSPTTK